MKIFAENSGREILLCFARSSLRNLEKILGKIWVKISQLIIYNYPSPWLWGGICYLKGCCISLLLNEKLLAVLDIQATAIHGAYLAAVDIIDGF